MKKDLFSIFSILLLLTSCEQREWSNPFDPDCPKDIWTPTNFQAVQEGRTVKLSWNEPNPNIGGFKLKKTVGILNPVLKDLPVTSTQLIDSDPVPGQLQTYEITAYAGGNSSNPATITITPLFPSTLSTYNPTSITGTTMVVGGTIDSDGGATVTSRGICWALTASPTTDSNKLAIGSGTGPFSATLTNLSPNTLYYFRAYAINSQGTVYGNEVQATTLVVLPTLSTTAISAILSTTATGGGIIISNGSATVIASGICYATTTGPTIANTKISGTTAIGSFVSYLTGLSPGTAYFVKAYATNSLGTGYGSEVTFTTPAVLASLTTTAISNIGTTIATGGGNITSNGGATITVSGICWSTSQNPTTANPKTTNGTSTGAFTSNLTGLTTKTTYYVKAYATNSVGTSYATQVSFTTK